VVVTPDPGPQVAFRKAGEPAARPTEETAQISSARISKPSRPVMQLSIADGEIKLRGAADISPFAASSFAHVSSDFGGIVLPSRMNQHCFSSISRHDHRTPCSRPGASGSGSRRSWR
jgi:hypothetical protein